MTHGGPGKGWRTPRLADGRQGVYPTDQVTRQVAEGTRGCWINRKLLVFCDPMRTSMSDMMSCLLSAARLKVCREARGRRSSSTISPDQRRSPWGKKLGRDTSAAF